MCNCLGRSQHLLLRPQENDTVRNNPSAESDSKWILPCNHEGAK